jgi:hypothetical protein
MTPGVARMTKTNVALSAGQDAEGDDSGLVSIFFWVALRGQHGGQTSSARPARTWGAGSARAPLRGLMFIRTSRAPYRLAPVSSWSTARGATETYTDYRATLK